MILYTCEQKKAFASIGHPCGRAAKALDEAGYEYEIRALPGYRLAPWTWGERTSGRKEVEELTGQVNLPVLVLDEGRTVAGSGKIVDWARAHPAYQPEVGGG
ncbi:MAG TPA: glutathione S-transferase N-terminal domain-containing protein [Solirubrobacterales bacterium]|nr:glutathione S-transferase N-terminal domain-containing protein [Solirubrobacterales bacterium]